MSTILVIDDDPLIHHRFRRDFEDSEISLLTAGTAQEGVSTLAKSEVDVVVLDVMLPDQSGLETFQRIHQEHPRTPIIFITSSAESETAIEAMKLGAFDLLLKPLDQAEVRQLVGRALEIRRLSETPVAFDVKSAGDTQSPDVLIGRCSGMQDVYKAIGRVAPQDVTVLIQGESGTGKELVARAIYQHSRRSKGPFLAINCAAIPEALLESELFGHEKGAFTGADRQRIGKFEQCSGGTLLLDEIGDMTPATQSKVLRLLQHKQFERVGGTETIHADVRIIAATHRNLEELASQGKFRRDLFYRLNVIRITLPPLRERLSDISLLLQHFLKQFSQELDRRVNAISPEALDILVRYPWPGNVREFQSVLKHAILHAAGPVLLPDFLPQGIRAKARNDQEGLSDHGMNNDPWAKLIDKRLREGAENLQEEMMAHMERQLITAVLNYTAGNKLHAAKILGVSAPDFAQ